MVFLGRQAKTLIGREGEEVASQFLLTQGFSIQERNYRCPQGEIDIIARRQKELYFFEVKLRGLTSLGYAYEMVHKSQKRRIRRAAERYLADLYADRPDDLPPCNFGVVAIDEDATGQRIELIEDTFE